MVIISKFKKYIFVGFGELVLDKIYNEQLQLIKENGGCPVFNVSYNLSMSGENVYVIGGVGNDENGIKAIESLKNGNVNTNNVQYLDKRTNVNHMIIPDVITSDNSVRISQVSPITNERVFKLADNLPTAVPEDIIGKDVILVVSNFQKPTFEFINNLKQNNPNTKVAMDIGNIMFFKDLPREYLEDFLSNIDIVQMNQNCSSDLYQKLGISSNKEFYDMFNFDLLTVTKGHEGADFVYSQSGQTMEKSKKPPIVATMKDPTGAGDAFFSMMLKAYNKSITREKTIDEDFVDNAFVLANSFSRQIVNTIGARGDLNVLEKLILNLKEEKKDTVDYFYGDN